MRQQATITGPVSYREGDGPLLTIPQGPVELLPAPDSMTLGWRTDNGAAGSAALPRDVFEQHVRDGRIRLSQ